MFTYWNIKENDEAKTKKLCESSGMSEVACRILVSRGLDSQQQVDEFLHPHIDVLDDPNCFKDMDKAVKRINQAIEAKQKIVVFGDYDADGVTSSYILYDYLKQKCGDNVTKYIPSRELGYGLNCEAIKKLKADRGIDLIITVDNGINAFDEVIYASLKGIDMVITDHHCVTQEDEKDKLPKAVAVVNPHRKDCESTNTELCGVGVALMLVAALEGSLDYALEKYGEIAAIGTLADIVSLKSYNRCIVRAAMKPIENFQNKALVALLKKITKTTDKVTSKDIAYMVVPRINAAGRIDRAEFVVDLLCEQDDQNIDEMVDKLIGLNDRRREIEKDIFDEVCKYIDNNKQILDRRVIIAYGNDWNHGIVGIVCAKIMTKYKKPCILISIENGEARGSARSFGEFSLYEALVSVEDILTRFGGHKNAAGFSLDEEDIADFEKRINDYAKESYKAMPNFEIKIDSKVRGNEVTVAVLDEISQFEPFGKDNEEIVFAIENITIAEIYKIGVNKQHIKIKFKDGNSFFDALMFNVEKDCFEYQAGDNVDILVTMSKNEYNGRVSVSMFLKDIRPFNVDQKGIFLQRVEYEKIKLGEKVDVKIDRDDVAVVYRYLKSNSKFLGSMDRLVHILKSNTAKVCLCVDVLKELELIDVSYNFTQVEINIINTDKKVELANSATYQKFGS